MKESVSQLFLRASETRSRSEQDAFLRLVGQQRSLETYEDLASLLEFLPSADQDTTRPIAFVSPKPSVVEELKLPQKFGNYTLLEEIGRGGMGIVYKARQDRLERTVALKMMHRRESASRIEVSRFFEEARLASQLNHPNIVPIFEVGEFGKCWFFTMNYIDGETLKAVSDKGHLNQRDLLSIFLTLCTTVEWLHKNGIIHGDIKPSNVLLRRMADHDRKAYEVYLTDFGLAVASGTGSHLEDLGGTPGFLAPEFYDQRRRKPTLARDIYALGAALYYCLSGKTPDSDRDQSITLQKSISTDLTAVVGKALAADPSGRFTSSANMAKDIESLLEGRPVRSRKISPLTRFTKLCRRRPTSVVACVLTVVLLVAAIVVPWVSVERAQENAARIQAAHLETIREQAKAVFQNGIISALHQRKSSSLDSFRQASELAESTGDEHFSQVAKLNEDLWADTFWRLQRLFPPATDPRVFSISSDHSLLARSRSNGSIIIEDLSVTGRTEEIVIGAEIASLCFDKTNKHLLVVERSGQVIIIDSLEERWLLRSDFRQAIPDSVKVVDLQFSESANCFILLLQDSRVLKVTRGGEIETLLSLGREPRCLSLARQTGRLAIAMNSNEVVICQLSDKASVQQRIYSDFRVGAAALSSDGQVLFIAREDRFYGELYRLSSEGRFEKEQRIPSKTLTYSTTFSPDSKVLVTAGKDGVISFTKLDTLEPAQVSLECAFIPKTLHISESNDTMLISGNEGSLGLFRRPSSPIAFSAQNLGRLNWAKFQVKDGRIWAFDLNGKGRQHAIDPVTNAVDTFRLGTGQAPLTKGQYLRTSDSLWVHRRGSARVEEINLRDKTTASYFTCPVDTTFLLEKDRTETQLALFSQESIFVYNISSKSLRTLKPVDDHQLKSLAFSADGQSLFYGSRDGELVQLRTSDGSLVRRQKLSTRKINSLFACPVSDRLAIGCEDGKALVLNQTSWSTLGPEIQHTTRVDQVTLLGDTGWLASSVKGETIQLWDIKTGYPLGPPFEHPARVRWIDYVPETHQLLSVCFGGTVALHNMPLRAEVEK